MDNLDYIENYFTNSPGPSEVSEFENKIGSDPDFAEEVAFYLSALQVSRESAREEKKKYFKELYRKRRVTVLVPIRKLIYFVAAAAIVTGILIGVYISIKPVSPKQLADTYIKENLMTQGVTMSGERNPLQTAIGLYNDGKTNEALLAFENIIRSDSSDFNAKKFAGLSALRLNDYNKAIHWFEALELHKELYANPAQLYMALTLMERNQPGDLTTTKEILHQIVQNDGDGKETAQEWLKRLK
jgi:tetratricopeptide (TPR) repeat protein